MGFDTRSLGPMHLSTNSAFEPQRTNNFQVEFYNLPGQGTMDIMLACHDFSLPTVSNEPIEIGHGNSTVKFAGRTSFAGMETLSVIDWITTDMEKVIDAWRYLVYNPEDDTIGWASRYKKTGTITEFGPDGTFFRNWSVIGAWPNSVTYGETLSHEGSEAKKISMNISYDKCFRI